MTDDEREIVRLKNELKEAQFERDILKKAVSTISKSDKKFTNLQLITATNFLLGSCVKYLKSVSRNTTNGESVFQLKKNL